MWLESSPSAGALGRAGCRRYLCVCAGAPSPATGAVRTPVGKRPGATRTSRTSPEREDHRPWNAVMADEAVRLTQHLIRPATTQTREDDVRHVTMPWGPVVKMIARHLRTASRLPWHDAGASDGHLLVRSACGTRSDASGPGIVRAAQRRDGNHAFTPPTEVWWRRERVRPRGPLIPRRRPRGHRLDDHGPRDPQPRSDPRLRQALRSKPPDQRPILQSNHSPIVECSLFKRRRQP